MPVLACKTKNISIIVKGHRVPHSVREARVALNEVFVALANGANNALKQRQGNNGNKA